MNTQKKIIRATTIAASLETFCKDLLKELSKDYDVVALSSPGDVLDYVGQRENVRTIGVKMERHISLTNDLVSLFKLIKIMRKEKPWLVHSMTPKAGLLCMIAAWITRVPRRVHTFTGLIWPTATGISRRILMFTDKILCACATHIIPEGEGVKRDIIAGKITKKPMKILANGNVRGIDLEHYSRSNDVMGEVAKIKKEGTFTYIFVGRIVGDKGIHELVDAFVKVHQQRPNTRLILVGRMEPHLDPLSNEVQETINTHEAIEAVGIQKDVRPWLAAADVLTFPSYREGFPNVVIEAGAMGLPAIVTDINGANEIIIAEENGIIIPSHDAEALYNAMIAMHDNQEMRKKMATNARPLIAQRFDCHIVRKALYDFYASL